MMAAGCVAAVHAGPMTPTESVLFSSSAVMRLGTAMVGSQPSSVTMRPVRSAMLRLNSSVRLPSTVLLYVAV